MPILKRALAAALLVALSLAAPPAHGQGGHEAHHFTYDGADNLLSRTVVRDGVASVQAMPLDGSQRNRPTSVGGVPLEWDANGNLKRKGELSFAYDSRNRLTAARDAQGTVLATYVYDAFGRRVEQRIGGDVITTMWAGQRPVETYINGMLQTRRTYGRGLDEVVLVEHDLDGDGVLEQGYTPIYDSSGNLAVVTDSNGKPIERFSYSPFGDRRVFVDVTPPRLDQVRVVDGELWLEVSDAANPSAVTAALANGKLRLEADSEAIPLSYDGTKVHARRHRVELQLDAPPATGTALTLHVEPEAILDLFHNTLPDEVIVSFAWPEEDTVVFDAHAPQVHEVAFRQAVLELELTEEIDLATATASIQIAGYEPSWTKSNDGYRLVASDPLPAGTHDLLITDGLTDLAGQGLAQPFALEIQVDPQEPLRVAYREPDPRLTPESTIANELGLHGLPQDPITGFLYVRNRYLDPALGRFISSDPLGYVDGPNLYQFALNNPVDFHDPLGLESAHIRRRQIELGRAGLESLDMARAHAAPIARALAHPHAHGMLAILFGCSEAAAGIVGTAGTAGVGTVPGLLVAAHGSDVCASGVKTFYHGQIQPTQTQLVLDRTLMGLGANPQMSAGLATGTDAGLSMLGGGMLLRAAPVARTQALGFGSVDEFSRAVPGAVPKVHMGKQGKHIPGHNNYIEGRSILRTDPESLAVQAGTGQPVNQVPRGQPGFKERVDFGDVIGDFVEEGVATPTTKGDHHLRSRREYSHRACEAIATWLAKTSSFDGV